MISFREKLDQGESDISLSVTVAIYYVGHLWILPVHRSLHTSQSVEAVSRVCV